jgi:hypothetical protein
MATQLLGNLVWFSVNGSGKIDRNKLLSAAYNNSIPSSYMPREIDPGRAFKRALRKVELMSNKGEKYSGIVLTKVSEDSTRTVFTIHERSVDKYTENVEISQEDRIVFLKENCYIDWGSSRYVDEVRNLLGDCMTYYTAQDIRKIVTDLVKSYLECVPAGNDGGGVYFVAPEKLAMLQNIKNFIQETVGGGLQDWPVYEEKKSELGELCSNQFKAELNTLAEEAMDSLRDATQMRVFTNRLEKFKKFRNKVHCYAELLSFESTQMMDVISTLEESITNAISG